MRIHLNQSVIWLISYDSANMHINAYDMYVLSTCIRHKRHVKHIAKVTTLDRMFFHFNNDLNTEALARELILKYAEDDYESDSDEKGITILTDIIW